MVYIFEQMIEGCARRKARAWRELVKGYLPLARHFLARYAPALARDAETVIPRLFSRALASDAAFFRSFSGRTEREFMVHFRAFLIACARAMAAAPSPGAPVATLEVLESALNDFTVLQRQIVWLYALGYDPAELGPILKVKAETVAQAVADAQERLRASMELWSTDSLRASAPALVEALSARETPDCYPYLTYHRIMDGQITWKDRDAALAHLTRCFRCVDRFCVFQEAVYYYRKLPAATPAEVEAVIKALGFPLVGETKPSLVARLFGRRRSG